MKRIEKQNFPHERDLYGVSDVLLENCTFDGKEDGESALKEASDVRLRSCLMNLRYPLWHNKRVELTDVTMTDQCRAALWYTDDITVQGCKLFGIKALRECRHVKISDTEIVSPEFGWKSHDIALQQAQIESEYLFFMASDIRMDHVKFQGKYSFQYVENAEITNSVLKTKDAFWHTKNVTVKDSVIKGEYLGWYSENLTLINCAIVGTQPLCYCKDLTLIDCTMEDTDLSFEYSDVNAVVKGSILSVKNPKSGRIACERIGELIYTGDSKYVCSCEIEEKGAAAPAPNGG